MTGAISGAHIVLFSKDARADRAFLRDVLQFPSVDAGEGWLIFALPPAEVAVHPAEESESAELFLLCKDLSRTLKALDRKGVRHSRAANRQWGRVARIKLPSGRTLGLYQPRHPLAVH